jgi:hypothetical protein
MKNQGIRLLLIVGLIACGAWMVSCDDGYNDSGGESGAPIGQIKTYNLTALGGSGVSGTVSFQKISSTSTLVKIQLTGTVLGDSHPAHIHSNNSADGGAIAVDLNHVDGETGMSETTIIQLNDATSITYEDLIRFNGHVNVHKSEAELAVIITQGNIGSNSGGDGGDTGDGGY